VLPLHPGGEGQSRDFAHVPGARRLPVGLPRLGAASAVGAPLVDARLSERIAAIHARSRDSYGVRRVYLDLRDQGVRVGRKRVERLMRTAGLSGYVKRRKGTTTIRVPGVRVADDLVGRDFNPQAPNRLWTSDIKYVSTWEGTLYLASVIDCYSRRVVGWGCAPTCRPSSSSTPSRWRSRGAGRSPA